MWKIIFGKRQKPPTFAVAFRHVYYSAFLSLHPFIYVDIFQLDFIRLKKCLISKNRLSGLSLIRNVSLNFFVQNSSQTQLQ